MIAYSVKQIINRPISEVFPHVAHPLLHSAWMDVSNVEIRTPGDVRPGTVVHSDMKMRSRHVPSTWEVTELEPNARVAFHTTQAPMDWDGSFDLTSEGDATTRITASGQIRLRGWQRLLEPLMSGEVRRGEAAELARLKELLEGPG